MRLWAATLVRTGVLIGAIGAAAGSGCWTSGNNQAKDGQSHWLDRCSSPDDCSGDQICACGVCTVSCGTIDSCGVNATCAPVAERAACEDAPGGTLNVCLHTCADDLLCEENELACIDAACVAADDEQPRDASTGADAAGRDPESMDVDASADASSGADAGGLTSGAPEEQSPGRPDCPADRVCAGNTVCHIDDTCIERGVPDENGIASLAVAAPVDLSSDMTSRSVGAFIVHDDAVYFQDSGTMYRADLDLPPEPDGGVYRYNLVTNQVTAIVANVRMEGFGLHVDDLHVYYPDRTKVWVFERSTGATFATTPVATPSALPVWTVSSGNIYYLLLSDGFYQLRENTLSGDGMLANVVGVGSQVTAITSDLEHVYLEVATPSMPTQLMAYEITTRELRVVSASFREAGAPQSRLLIHDGALIADRLNTGVQRTAIDTGETSVIAELPGPTHLGNIDGGFAYFYRYRDRDSSGRVTDTIMRVALAGGEPELLHESDNILRLASAVAKAGYLYWVEEGRLVRKQL